MAILRDITEVEGNTGNIATSVRAMFQEFDAEKANEAIGLLAESLADDNLTLYAKDNGMLNYTSRALVLNSIANGINYALSATNKSLDKLIDEIKNLNQSYTGTEFDSVKVEQRLERLAIIENNIDSLEQVFQIVKHHYKNTTLSDWQPYVPPSKTQTETQAKADMAQVLAKYAR
jgi:septation ring formation regulator EzrA